MSARFHTPLAFGAVANAAVYNTVAGGFDSSVEDLLEGNVLWTDRTDSPPAPAAMSLYIKNQQAITQTPAGTESIVSDTTAVHQIVALTELGAPAANITLSSIPGTYKHLWLRLRLRDDRAIDSISAGGLEFNGDANPGNYLTAQWTGVLLSTRIAGVAALIDFIWSVSNLATSGNFATWDIWIWDYASTTRHKVVTFKGVAAIAGTNSRILTGGGVWRNMAALTSIVVDCFSTNNYIAGSAYELWGMD